MDWQPLPPDVAEWMGMDDSGVPAAVVAAEDSVALTSVSAPVAHRRGVLGFVRRSRRHTDAGHAA